MLEIEVKLKKKKKNYEFVSPRFRGKKIEFSVIRTKHVYSHDYTTSVR